MQQVNNINWNDPKNGFILPDHKPQGVWFVNNPTLTRKIKVKKGYTNLPKDLYSPSKKHKTFGIKVKG
tara:strand:+ start:1494 stop:1697 length:204 start_codon:yes stop_codon:yes gene_type:complete